MTSSYLLKMGHIDMGVYIYCHNFESDLRQLLQSLSFNLPVSFLENIYVVFVTPNTPDWYVNSIDLPEWGKQICNSMFHIAQNISHDSHGYQTILNDLLKVSAFGPKDWFAPKMKVAFYHHGNQLICFALLFEEGMNREATLRKISNYLFFCAIYWYSSHRGLFLHGAAVSNNQAGFLFLGEGGAGKSTAASLCASIGISVLSDDLAFILRKGKGNYELAAAPGPNSRYSTNPLLRPTLKGVFRLVKDSSDSLKPLSQTATAHILFRSFEWSQWVNHLSPQTVSEVFLSVSDIARSIPGYELHFRKSPDFWKLIDGYFPE